MKINILISLALFVVATSQVLANESMQLKDEIARINYSLGYQIGNDFRQQGVKMDSAAVIKGIEDAIAGGKPLLDPQIMHTTLVDLKRKVVAEQQTRHRETDLANIASDKNYLQEALKKPDMHTTKSGLVYRIIASGEGSTPKPTDKVTVNYRGTLTNGNEFDSSYKRGEPANFPLNGVIKGWTEGLQLIKEGGKVQLIIPSDLAYGDRGPLAHRTLIFDVELISVGEKTNANIHK